MGYAALGALIIGGGTAALTAKGARRPGPPPVMPDQTTLLKEQTLQESKDAAVRYGRAATVLNYSGGGSTTGDKLGP
jgi:hypothetical protein